MTVTVIYDNKKDKELLNLIDSPIPFFVDYINYNTIEGRKEANKIKGYYAARLNPFIEILDDSGKLIKAFYSENGNAVQSFIRYLNESIIQKTT